MGSPEGSPGTATLQLGHMSQVEDTVLTGLPSLQTSAASSGVLRSPPLLDFLISAQVTNSLE